MKALIINFIASHLAVFLKASLSGRIGSILALIVSYLKGIIERLTDDDKDNTGQIEAYFEDTFDQFLIDLAAIWKAHKQQKNAIEK